jgi:hypothetical protein
MGLFILSNSRELTGGLKKTAERIIIKQRKVNKKSNTYVKGFASLPKKPGVC